MNNLPKYKSHKIVEALKITAIEIKKNGSAIIAFEDRSFDPITTGLGYSDKFNGTEEDTGYYVRYKDGYESWSPTKAFEEGYSKVQDISLCTFGEALEALKDGKRVTREGWNGKGMFLFLLPANDGIPTKVINDPALRKVIEEKVGGDTFDAYGSIRMWTADDKVLTGWLASQTDMLANDWVILSE